MSPALPPLATWATCQRTVERWRDSYTEDGPKSTLVRLSLPHVQVPGTKAWIHKRLAQGLLDVARRRGGTVTVETYKERRGCLVARWASGQLVLWDETYR